MIPSRPILDADYSAIEARIVNWLAGQEDALQEYRDGVDRYKVMASLIYKVPFEEVNKHPQRFVGKQATLGCGFQMSPDKFRMTCKKMGRYNLPLGLEHTAVAEFRAKHKKVVDYWYAIENAAQSAICNPGQMFTVRSVQLMVRNNVVEGMPFLLVRLPSGRKLAYPRPRLVPSVKFPGKMQIVFYGNIKGKLWGDVDTYGGKLVENITQAVAADIMGCGACNAEEAGYEIFTLIHDQALAFHKDGQTENEFVDLLTKLPPWANGLPVEAKCNLAPFYTKE